MKIALIHNIQSTGSALYRLELPHAHLDAAYKGLTFYSAPDPFRISDESFEQMDIVLVSRMWGETPEQIKWLRDKCTQFNVTLILDLDDYWVLESGHPMYSLYREKNISNIIRDHIRVVDHVICTNAYLKEKVSILNPNVSVIPNCTFSGYEQYKSKPEPSEFVRFGWFGGAQHFEDIILMESGMGILADDRSLNGLYRLYLGGWNENPMYEAYERVFTSNGKQENYGRIEAADIYSYVGGYNFVDVCLAPLRDTTFNRCKSELKLVEAGTMGKAIIASDVYPYNTIIDHGYNGFLVREARSKDWHKYMKTLIHEKDLRLTLADNLKETIEIEFNIDYWGAKRMDLYHSLR
jgi:glycosyltransferase involved in cell wall biosynthesis